MSQNAPRFADRFAQSAPLSADAAQRRAIKRLAADAHYAQMLREQAARQA